MPYSLKKRGDGWGVWNGDSERWMSKKPMPLNAAQGQIAALQASEHNAGWKPTGKAGREYKRTAFRRKTRKVWRKVA